MPSAFVLVPEMERPAGVLYQEEIERRLDQGVEVARGLDRMEAHLRALWPRVREIDLVQLSRYQIESTHGFELPEKPGTFIERRAIGRDDDGRWHLEMRGPRLPARHEIIFRYLYFFATYDPASGEIADLVVTIRGWIEE